MSRILVRRANGGLGDCIMSLSALRAAIEKYPNSEIIYALYSLYYPTLYETAISMGAKDAISPPGWVDKGDEGFIEEYAIKTFDHVIDLDGPEVRHAHETGWILTKNRIECFTDEVGYRPENMCPAILVNPRARLALLENCMFPAGLEPFTYIAVHYKSAEPFKDYPHINELIEVLRDAGHKVVIVHNAEVPNLSIEGKTVYSTMGRNQAMTASDMIAVVDMAKLAICVDSAVLHISAAVGCPAIGLFSGTDGALTCKYYPLVTILQNTEVQGKPCEATFPCYGLQTRNCWCALREGEEAGTAWCLEQITPYRVMDLVDELLVKHKDMNQRRARRVLEQIDQQRNIKVDKTKIAKRKTIVVGVPQGIGDSLWALTKIPAIMEDDGADGLVVICQSGKPARGREFIERFDFVDSCQYGDFRTHPIGEPHINPDGTYNYLDSCRNYCGMDWLLIPNGTLERGQRLETWLAEYDTDFDICKKNFRFYKSDEQAADRVQKSAGDNYVVFFLGATESNSRAGHNRAHSYTIHDWRNLGYREELYDGYEARSIWRLRDWCDLGKLIVEAGMKLVVIGAKYDASYARDFMAAYAKDGNDPRDIVNVCGQLHIAESLAVIKRAKAMFSYQAGTGISSTFMGVNTAIWWRHKDDSIEPPPNRHLGFSNSMNSSWSPIWATDSYMPLIYGMDTPKEIYENAVTRGWFGNGAVEHKSQLVEVAT